MPLRKTAQLGRAGLTRRAVVVAVVLVVAGALPGSRELRGAPGQAVLYAQSQRPLGIVDLLNVPRLADPQVSPDGHEVIYTRADADWKSGRRVAHVWRAGVDGGEPMQMTSGGTGEGENDPRWSPDGRTIAFLSAVPEKSHPKIWLAPSTGNAPSTPAADGIDLIPSQLRWAEDGRALYFETGVKGTSRLYRVDLSARRAQPITSGERTVHMVDVSEKTNRLAYGVNDPTHLDDLYVADRSGGNEKQLTHLNAAYYNRTQLVPVERVPFKGADGWDVDGFFMKPVGWEAGKKYPMILTIHGGPAGMFGFDWYHEFQVYAAHGWAVFFTNPRGSTGYGEKFERGIINNWGGMDYQDIMAGVDAALKQNPWIDRDRLGVTGGSYGGFMTNWILGHTDRFKAAVTLRSLSNFISDEGTRDGAYGHEDDFKGLMFDEFEQFWNASPLKYAKNVKTPTLILHSDNDFRVPLEQGEQWFRALKHYGVNAELVIFPRENHNLTRTGEPKHLVESMNWQVYWFERFLDGNPAAKPPDMP